MEAVDRRDFIKTVAGSAAFAAFDGKAAMPPEFGPIFLSTWAHGKPANERAAEVLKNGGSLLDAIEKGINVPENDPNVTTVGYGGIPNAEGVVELDAAIMDGTRHRAGSVCNLHMIKNPISVARLVMEKTRHTTLAGEGAFRFALKMGFEPQTLLTPQSLQKWQEWKADPHHQTFWMIAGESRHHRHGRNGWKRTRRCRLLDLRPGVQDSRPRGRFTAGGLRSLC